MFAKLRGLIGSQLFLGIGTAVALLKWSATLVSFRNKADTAWVDVAAKAVVLNDPAGTRQTTLGMPNGAGANLTFNLPTTAGSAGQVLQTDGGGNTSWVSAGSTSQCQTDDTTSLAFGSAATVAMFTLPANAVVRHVSVVVDTAFNGTPTMSVGIAGTTSKYVGTGDVDLTTAGEYEIPPGLAPVGATESLIITYSAGGASAGAARVIVTYSLPQ